MLTLPYRLRDRGPIELARLLAKNLRHLASRWSARERARREADQVFDRRWGTDTSGGIGVHSLGIDRTRVAHCRRYDPSDVAMLRAPVAALGIDPARFDFVDYGAGKGRVLMLAMEMGFRRVTGIELSAALCAVARRNLGHFRTQLAHVPPTDIVNGDAASYVPPPRDLVAYFYNPFDASVMDAVRRRLEASVAGGGRVIVIYANPEHGDVFAASPAWTVGPTIPGVATFLTDR